MSTDPVWRRLLRDVRFRRALSLAINRHEINRVMYFGQAIESQNTVLPESPLFKPSYQTSWASFDLAQANKLLDAIGLTRRNSQGIRLLPDGRPAAIIVETTGESSEEADVLQLGARQLAAGRHQAPHQAVAPRRRAQPHLRRQDGDGAVSRAGERHRDRGHEPAGARAGPPDAVSMAAMGPIRRNRRQGGRTAGHAGSREAAEPARRMEQRGDARRSARASGRTCWPSMPTSSSPSD